MRLKLSALVFAIAVVAFAAPDAGSDPDLVSIDVRTSGEVCSADLRHLPDAGCRVLVDTKIVGVGTGHSRHYLRCGERIFPCHGGGPLECTCADAGVAGR